MKHYQKIILPLLALSFLAGCENGEKESSTPTSEEPSTSSSMDIPEDATVADLHKIFNALQDNHFLVENEGYAKEYFLGENGYYCDYIDYIEYSGYSDFGYVVSPNQGMFIAHVLDSGKLKLGDSRTTSTDTPIYSTYVDSPSQWLEYSSFEGCWEQVVVDKENIPPVEEGQLPTQDQLDAMAKGVFISRDDDTRLLSGILGHLPISMNEDGEYIIDAISYIKARILQDDTLHIEVMAEDSENDFTMAAAIYEVKDYHSASFAPMDEYLTNPRPKNAYTEWDAIEIEAMEQYLGIVIPYPDQATYATKFTCNSIGGGLASIYDLKAGDHRSLYVEQCLADGWVLAEDDEEEGVRVVEKNRNEDGSKKWKINISFTEPTERDPDGVFLITAYVYPQEIVIPD